MDKKRLLDEKRKSIVDGLNKSFNKLVEFKKYKNSPLIVTRNGEIVELDPTTISENVAYVYPKK